MAEKAGAGGKQQAYDEESGQYGSGTSGEKLADAIKKYSDEPAHDLVAEGLPSGETPKLSKQEYATLRAEVMRKNATQRGKVKPVGQAFTANYFYIYSTKGGDDFTVVMQFDIEADRAEIDEILKGGKKGT